MKDTGHQLERTSTERVGSGEDNVETQGKVQILQPIDPDIGLDEKSYMRKLNLIILPMISTLYFFEYLDRGNIANAKLYGIDGGHQTPTKGLGPGQTSLSATDWQLVVMIFYVGLVLFQVPGCIGYRIFPPSKWIAFGVCGWSAASLLQCLAFNLGGELACRIFLGVFEGLFGTGIVYYLSLWYKRTELGVVLFWFLGPTAIAGAFSGLIAFGVGRMQSPIPAWQRIFLIEALPCFCLGLFCLYWLPDRPLKNSRFSGRDQVIAEARYRSETLDKSQKLEGRHVTAALTDWKLYAQAAIYVPTAALLSSISGFLPTIVSNLGYKDPAMANLMTLPPYACAFFLMYTASWSSDRFGERGFHIAVLMVLASVSYALLALLPESQLGAKYGCVCVAVASVYATFPPTHAWAANNFGNETKRAVGMGFYTAIGNLGSIGGTWLYPATDAPQFRKGHLICMALALATTALSLANSFALVMVNRRRDARHGKPIKGVAVDVTELADDSPQFRYIA